MERDGRGRSRTKLSSNGLRSRSSSSQSTGKVHYQTCPYPECRQRTTHLRKHLYIHLPRVARMDNIRSVPSSLLQKRSRFLRWLAGSGSLLDLMELVNKWFHPVAPQISEKIELAIREQIKYEGWPMPDVLSICPLNSPACLLHYRVLVF